MLALALNSKQNINSPKIAPRISRPQILGQVYKNSKHCDFRTELNSKRLVTYVCRVVVYRPLHGLRDKRVVNFSTPHY